MFISSKAVTLWNLRSGNCRVCIQLLTLRVNSWNRNGIDFPGPRLRTITKKSQQTYLKEAAAALFCAARVSDATGEPW